MEQANQNQAGQGLKAESRGIRVNLISEDGQLEVLFLPRMIEGKYLFRQAVSQKPLTFLSFDA